MPEKAVGFSGKIIREDCSQCGGNRKEIVQSQQYIGVGPLRIMGIGPRDFALHCQECGNLNEMSQDQKTKAAKLKYAVESSDESGPLLTSNTRVVKYRVLTSERRDAIRKDNRKEGLMSMLIGIFIAILVFPLPFRPWSRIIGGIIFVYSILGGLYAIFEDPERKHRDLIREGKKLERSA